MHSNLATSLRNKNQVILFFTFLLFTSINTIAQSVEVDKKLGAKNAEAVAQQMGIYDDPELTAYVAKVGNRLVAELENNPFEFQFFIADDPIPNAFALPGGYMYVTRGILALINTEDELATIMGHEIIHAYKRHSIKQAKGSILPRILEVPGNLVGAVISDDLGNLINAPISAGNQLFLSSYSRKHEKESDRLGVALAAKAGYNPNTLGPLLTRLADVIEALTGNAETQSYFSDHPFTPKRVAKIDKEIEKISWTESSKISTQFPSELNELTFGKNPNKGVFVDQKFLHPGLKLAITFPQNWQTANESATVGAVKDDENSAILLNLIDADKSPAEIGEVFIKSWQKQYKIQPKEAAPYSVSGNPGYHLMYELNTKQGKFILNVIWFKMQGQYYQMVGITTEADVDKYHNTAKSIHTATDEEINNINVYKIKVVPAQSKETLESVSDRSDNILKLNLLSIMNDIKTTDKLATDKKIKVVIQEKYKQ